MTSLLESSTPTTNGAATPTPEAVPIQPKNLTQREQEVLVRIAEGDTNQEIHERLHISVKTVEAHRAWIFKKVGAKNAANLVLLAVRHGLIKP